MNFSKGEILVPRDTQFPDGAVMVDGYDGSNQLLAHPLGGGFQHVYPVDDLGCFRVADAQERQRALFRRAKFSLMDSRDLFSGWTNGERWNGWAMPHFELAEAQRLIAWLKNEKAQFDGARDAFVTDSPDGEEELWQGLAVAISDGSSLKVYPVGAGCWCWDEIEGIR
jgi:hypothetical protein